jgi:ubiquinone/menaquinone biosynthesis C-methylase UbiE
MLVLATLSNLNAIRNHFQTFNWPEWQPVQHYRTPTSMVTFRFSTEDIQRLYDDYTGWITFVRTQEAKMVFSLPPLAGRVFRNALELGAGNGLQSAIIVDHCEHLVCTDINPSSYSELGTKLLDRQHDRISFQICNAENLAGFFNGQFELVYSSNVLEHIYDLPRALGEMRRVMSDDGFAVHAMPSRDWKFFNFLGYLASKRRPLIHGTSRSHFQEFIRFGKNWWANTFRNHGFEILLVARMPFYFGLRGRQMVIVGNKLGFTSSHVFILKKRNRPNLDS